jgi:imidazolonepropionase-like amidohydrolase
MSRNRTLWGAVALLLLAVPRLAAETIVLQHFTLIDGSGRDPAPDSVLVMTDGRISYVGPAARNRPPSGAQVIDLSGKYVIPGIINLHGHLGNVVELTQDPKFYTRENVEKNLRTYASYGVTSMVSMGSDQDLIFRIRQEQRAGRPMIARVFTAGRGFTGYGGYPTTVPGNKGIPFEVANDAEVERDLAQLAAKKVDVVKIWVDDHLGREEKIPLDLCKAIIDIAHKHKLRVAAHIFYLEDAKALVNYGLNELAHSVRDKVVDDELIAAMIKHGTIQTATLAREASLFAFAKPGPLLSDPFFTRALSPAVLETLRSPEYQARLRGDHDFDKYPGFLEMAQRNLKKLSDAGVKIGFGTDSGPPGRFQGYAEHWEMELMVQAGLTPMQVIVAASKTAAEFLGAKDLGTLDRGKWADLLVLGRNPLEDIRNTRSLEAVYIAGARIP